jgi:hypothetical protein
MAAESGKEFWIAQYSECVAVSLEFWLSLKWDYELFEI